VACQDTTHTLTHTHTHTHSHTHTRMAQMNRSRRTYQQVMSNISVSHVAHSLSHIAHIKVSRHAHNRSPCNREPPQQGAPATGGPRNRDCLQQGAPATGSPCNREPLQQGAPATGSPCNRDPLQQGVDAMHGSQQSVGTHTRMSHVAHIKVSTYQVVMTYQGVMPRT